MVIARPVTQTTISTGGWGIPITDQVNALQTWQTSMIPTPWVNVTFVNGWSNYPGLVTKYRRIGDIVYIQGGAQSGSIGSPIFYLPAGFMPPATVQFAQASYSILGIVTVASDGAVYPLAPTDVRFIGLACVFATT